MKTVLRVLVGLALGLAGLIDCVYLGPMLKGQPDWRMGVMAVVLLAAAQWVSFFAFRRRIALQVLFGSALCMAIAAWLLYSRIPLV